LIGILWRTLILDIFDGNYPAPQEAKYAFLNAMLIDLTYLYAPIVEEEQSQYKTYKENFYLLLDLLDLLRSADPASDIESREILTTTPEILHDKPGSGELQSVMFSGAKFHREYSEHISLERQIGSDTEGLSGLLFAFCTTWRRSMDLAWCQHPFYPSKAEQWPLFRHKCRLCSWHHVWRGN
jgi:hypothetical protein